MKLKIALLICAVLAASFAIALLVTRQKAVEQQQQDAEKIAYNSNQWQVTEMKLTEEKQVTTLLNRDLDTQKKAYADLTNSFTQTAEKLTTTEASLSATAASLKTAQETITQRDTRIAQLEAQNNELDKQAIDLSTAITNLTAQIEDTQRKLTASEGDKAFLEKELKRLMAEKADLERQFNDLKVLRAQVAKLKEELNIARRIEWIRKGLGAPGEVKGAAQLMQGANAPGKRTETKHYDLNVEVNADGTVRVIPPLTNAPAGTNAPGN